MNVLKLRLRGAGPRPLPPQAMPRVVILAAHPQDGWSMRRYSTLLQTAYRAHGWQVEVRAPRSTLSRRLSTRSAKKFAKYFESAVLFPFELAMGRRHDLVHLADHSNALWLLFVRTRGAAISTCHDLIALRAARGEIADHPASVLGKLFQWLMLRGLSRSRVVIAVSRDTQNCLGRLLPGTATEHIPNPVLPPIGAAEVLPMRERKRFALLVASTGWRKRRDRGIEYWTLLRSQAGFTDLKLVVIGPPLTPAEASAAGDDIAEVEVRSAIPDAELAELYRNAVVLLHPSAFEGFGWPIIEANASGTPVVANDIAVSREVGPQNLFVPERPATADWSEVSRAISTFPARSVASFVREAHSVDRFEHQLCCLASTVLGVDE